MIIFLVAGIVCLALCGMQLTRSRLIADRDRQAALQTVRSVGEPGHHSPDTKPRVALLATMPALLAKIHMKLWRKESPDDITAQLLRAGAPRRMTSEYFMAGRVALTGLGLFTGFALAHGGHRIVLALVFGAAGLYLPGFALKRAASNRAERIDADLPQFLDQLAIAIDAGMSFDAAMAYLIGASDGPLTDELKRIMAELRVGQSRRAAMRSFADRVGTENVIAFANAVLASEQLGSPLANILRAQAADFRHRRQMLAEERAQKAPVKMMFPIVLFIFPVMFIVILGPIFVGNTIF
jgi:tight adherence protein C